MQHHTSPDPPLEKTKIKAFALICLCALSVVGLGTAWFLWGMVGFFVLRGSCDFWSVTGLPADCIMILLLTLWMGAPAAVYAPRIQELAEALAQERTD